MAAPVRVRTVESTLETAPAPEMALAKVVLEGKLKARLAPLATETALCGSRLPAVVPLPSRSEPAPMVVAPS